MKRKVIFISELGRTFNTKSEAIADDLRLPHIIEVYQNDLNRMNSGLKEFGGESVTGETIQNWKNAVARYEGLWEAAKLSHKQLDGRE